jgi:[protein-PII] uridylyltransferase
VSPAKTKKETRKKAPPWRTKIVAELKAVKGSDMKPKLMVHLHDALADGRAGIREKLEAGAIDGPRTARELSDLMDQIVGAFFELAREKYCAAGQLAPNEALSVIATGGYGRRELAPYSDLDLLFLVPKKRPKKVEEIIEFVLYGLWDLGLKVGHATRSIEDCMRFAKADLTILTSLLDARLICGDKHLFDDFWKSFQKGLIQGRGRKFVEAKLEERNQRHIRMGDSRYVVEPNLKDGKGGLRDLQTLFWIVRFLYGVRDIAELVDEGLLSESELKQFKKAERFLWGIRCYLHFHSGRAEERLTFDVQGDLAKHLRYKDHPGLSGTERFMKHYFLVAKEVGELTRVFCAFLEAQQQKPKIFSLARLRRQPRLGGFRLDGGRLNVSAVTDFEEDPVRLLKIFWLADEYDYDIHPDALRLVNKSLKRIDGRLRRNTEANEYFLSVLTSRKTPEKSLRRMNEAGVFGRFVPDFGRIVAMMQHDMYHHYTVDEHTIRAIGLLSQIEIGDLEEDHPIASEIIHKIGSRRALYMAVLLHDIAKGRGGNHSMIGERVAQNLCPRVGLTPSETDLVAWLVRYHLVMSNFAFKRDLSDPKTVEDFTEIVNSLERLRLLVLLTVVDIRAVGPNIWNGWKRQLLQDLYYAAEEVLLAGHIEVGHSERVKAKKKALKSRLGKAAAPAFKALKDRLLDNYWIAVDTKMQAINAKLMWSTDQAKKETGISISVDRDGDRSRVAIYTRDRPGLFAKLSGALAVLGANIVDAKVFTTEDGMAVDNFAVQTPQGHAFEGRKTEGEIRRVIEATINGQLDPSTRLYRVPTIPRRTDVFKVEPLAIFDNRASGKYTVLEINARDRTGLLYDLTSVLYGQRISIYSAHIATYGERAVDVFYIRELDGRKITHPGRLRSLESKLLEAAGQTEDATLAG